MAKKKVKKAKKAAKSKIISDSKFNVIVGNLLLFIILFVVAIVLYSATSNATYKDLFFILSMIFGFVGLAFLISFLIYIFARYFRK